MKTYKLKTNKIEEKVVEAIKEAIEAEKEVEVTTTVVAEPVKEEAVDKADVKLVAKAADGSTVAQYLDLSVLMTVVVDGDEANAVTGEVTELDKEVTFTIAVPEELKAVKEGYTREFYIIRVHEGETEKLPVTVNADGTLSFKTDRFSTYALAYTDTAIEEETPTDKPEDKPSSDVPADKPEDKPSIETTETEAPKTGDTNTMMPWIAIMAVAAAGAVVFKKKEN